MNGGVLHSAAALDLLGRIQDARAQNLANASTVGYRRRFASAEAFSHALRQAAGLRLPHLSEAIDFTQGQLRSTEQPLDLAIEGKGFFALETGDGVRYTRNGNFALDAGGILVAQDGSRVRAEGGGILQADPARGALSFAASGEVRQGNDVVGRLELVEFADTARLRADADGRFRADTSAGAGPATDSNVRQGFLENANVGVVEELVQMISGFRAFEAAQKTLVGIDRIRTQAVSGR